MDWQSIVSKRVYDIQTAKVTGPRHEPSNDQQLGGLDGTIAFEDGMTIVSIDGLA